MDNQMREVVLALRKIEAHLDVISKSFSTLVKIENRKVPEKKNPYLQCYRRDDEAPHEGFEEEDDDDE